jgi:endonuclease/exonuclease/phosphatase family metal-dependent hydrolase
VAGHLLPWPRTGVKRSMRRIALEVTVQASFGAIRVVNTHLEFHSAAQREAQIARLLDLQQEASVSPLIGSGSEPIEPYGSQIAAASGLLCGDFNFDVSDPQYRLLHGSARPGLNYRDAWTICHPDRASSTHLRNPRSCAMAQRARLPRLCFRHGRFDGSRLPYRG